MADVSQMPWKHDLAHNGKRWVSGGFNASLADAATLVMVVEVGATKDAHMVALGTCGGLCTLEILAITGKTAGTPLTPVNRNTNETAAALVTITGAPSAIADEAALTPLVLVPVGIVGNASGGSDDASDEVILKASGKYAVRLVNISGGAAPANVYLGWYDLDPVTGVA